MLLPACFFLNTAMFGFLVWSGDNSLKYQWAYIWVIHDGESEFAVGTGVADRNHAIPVPVPDGFLCKFELFKQPSLYLECAVQKSKLCKQRGNQPWRIQIWGQIVLFKSLWRTAHVWLHAVLSWLSTDGSELSPAVRQGSVNSQIWLQIWIQRVDLPWRVKNFCPEN